MEARKFARLITRNFKATAHDIYEFLEYMASDDPFKCIVMEGIMEDKDGIKQFTETCYQVIIKSVQKGRSPGVFVFFGLFLGTEISVRGIYQTAEAIGEISWEVGQ